MIKQFETALATGQSLEAVRDHLRSEADNVRQARYAEIERAYNFCQLILFGITEPATSAAGGIARGYVRQCKKEYQATKEGKERQQIIRALKKTADDSTETTQKGKVANDDNGTPEHEEREQNDVTGEEGNQHDI